MTCFIDVYFYSESNGVSSFSIRFLVCLLHLLLREDTHIQTCSSVALRLSDCSIYHLSKEFYGEVRSIYLSMDRYDYVLHMTNLVAMTMIYMVNFMQTHTNLVCICRFQTLLFKTAISSNIWLNFLLGKLDQWICTQAYM